VSESFRDLIAWQKGMALITGVYRATESFPTRERYGLVDQLCRAVVAIPSDIAEGRGRLSKKEFLQMVARARGSSYEVQTQLEAAFNLGYLPPDRFEALLEKASEVSRLLNGLIKNLQQQIAKDDRRPPKSY
jgi:four helix bundle protein